MAYSLQQMLSDVQAIGLGQTVPYITTNQKRGRLDSVDVALKKISFTFINDTKNPPTEESGNFTQDTLSQVADALGTGTPINIDAVLNGGGNKRAVLEAFLAHTEHVFVCYLSGVKHLFWTDVHAHSVGELCYLAPGFVANQYAAADQMEADFQQWLVRQPSRGETGLFGSSHATTYCTGLRTCLNDPVFDRVLVKNLFEVQSDSCFQILFDTIRKVPGYPQYNKGWNNQAFNAAMGKYLKFLQEKAFSMPVHNGISEFAGLPLQRITYGAPGTGKSFGLNDTIDGWSVVRTTFHPDSDYSTFVGAYKPTMIGTTIGYRFVPQAFLSAYVQAWKDQEHPQFLIIEEINRGNCAQIFGDLFQLLDRDDSGESRYPIDADRDIATYLADVFAAAEIGDSDVKSGAKLKLPSNLYIWATMNTSDQSLFPMDSAFKRRWDWKYVPIKNANLGWEIVVGDCEVDWWKFLVAINKVVKGVTNSADKQMGYFFVRAKDSVIDAEMFVNKVAFYLWNDVFKDCELDGEAFKITREDGEVDVLAFQDFFKEDGAVNEEVLKNFLTTLVPPPEAVPGESGSEPAAGGES